jgi:signal transduction histidine kinase
VGLLRTERSQRTKNRTVDYLTTPQGDLAQAVANYDYDALNDDWYTATKKQQRPIWAKTYPAFIETSSDPSENAQSIEQAAANELSIYLAISAAAPIRDRNGQFIGVLSVDLALNSISQVLNQIPVSPSGEIFIIEPSGLLVANSKLQPNYKLVGEQEVERLSALESSDTIIRESAQFLEQQFGNFERIQQNHTFDDIQLNGKKHFLHVAPWQDKRGLTWLIVTTVPESDVMTSIHRQSRNTIIVCIATLAGALAIGHLTSRRITKPIRQLSLASESITSGDFDQTIQSSRILELNILSNSFNCMAQKLQMAFSDLATTNDALQTTNETLETRVIERTSELTNALDNLQKTQAQLVQQEKMSSLGGLVAGVAHEINNPVNFIHGNLDCTQEYTQDLLDLIALYQAHVINPPEAIKQKIQTIDLDFLAEDLAKTLESMKNGTSRIRSIVLSLRNFSRLDESSFKIADIHEGLESTLMILQNQLTLSAYGSTIELIKIYGDIPEIECYPSELNQVFLNLMLNAIDALETSMAANSKHQPTLTIRTQTIDANWIEITIADNGIGIPQEQQGKLFDPFFTTKPVGKGTGLGLFICYQTITDRHQGSITCQSQAGYGTTFTLKLPINQALQQSPSSARELQMS